MMLSLASNLKMMWKGVLYEHLSDWTERSYRKPQERWSVSCREPNWDFRMRSI